ASIRHTLRHAGAPLGRLSLDESPRLSPSSEPICRWSPRARPFRLSRKLAALARLQIIRKPIPALFITDGLMAFPFSAHDNDYSSRQLKISRVTNKFIDKERGSEPFDTNPS